MLEKHSLQEFRNYRGQYIEEIIAIVSDKHDDNLRDYVAVAVTDNGAVNTCKKCVKTYKRNVIICQSCGISDSAHDLNYDPYYRTLSKHPDVAPKLTNGKPCTVNPNSIEAVPEVVENFQKVTGLNDESNPRKWTFLHHSDGVPHLCAAILQGNVVKNNSCN